MAFHNGSRMCEMVDCFLAGFQFWKKFGITGVNTPEMAFDEQFGKICPMGKTFQKRRWITSKEKNYVNIENNYVNIGENYVICGKNYNYVNLGKKYVKFENNYLKFGGKIMKNFEKTTWKWEKSTPKLEIIT